MDTNSLGKVSAYSRMRPWVDDVPQGALETPARFEPGAVVRTAVPVRKSNMATVVARHAIDPAEALLRSDDWVPVSRSARERAEGVYVEARRSKGKTVYRPIRTTDMDDETPLPTIAYRTSKVLR